jgi:hypothetical protein
MALSLLSPFLYMKTVASLPATLYNSDDLMHGVLVLSNKI